MTPHDAINAAFEGGGAIFLCLNVRRLLKDKSVKGVSLVTTSWWTAWGFWNVYFYSAVNTPASFWAGIAVVIVNAAWLALAVYYARREAPTAASALMHACRCKSKNRPPVRRGQVASLCPRCEGVYGQK